MSDNCLLCLLKMSPNYFFQICLFVPLCFGGDTTTDDHLNIVGGYDCLIEDHPYMANIVITRNLAHYCGGSILSARWILTAGHCGRENYQSGSLSVIVGLSESDFKKRPPKTGQASKVVAIRFPTERLELNDIALMRLGSPLHQSRHVQFVRLATDREDAMEFDCKNVVVLGWGIQYAKNSHGKPVSDPIHVYNSNLQCIHLRTIDSTDCMNRLQRYVPGNFICAFDEGKDACQGDSGGPLLCNGVQYGIVSSGQGCAYKDYPGIYTDVRYYNDFIKNTLNTTDSSSRLYSVVSQTIITLLINFMLN